MTAGPVTSLGTQIEKNMRVEAALAHPRDVDIAVGVADTQIEAAGSNQALCRVGVRVDHDCGVVYAPSLVRNDDGSGRWIGRWRRERDEQQKRGQWGHGQCMPLPPDSFLTQLSDHALGVTKQHAGIVGEVQLVVDAGETRGSSLA